MMAKRSHEPKTDFFEKIEDELDQYIKDNDHSGVKSIFGIRSQQDANVFLSRTENQKNILETFANIITNDQKHTITDRNYKEIIDIILHDGFGNRDDTLAQTLRHVGRKMCQIVIIYKLNERREYKPLSPSELPSENGAFYRGHRDYSWRMVPSMLRGFNKTKHIDSKVLLNIYDKIGLLKKYNERIESIDKHNPKNIYEFITYMQHSLSYSPLLDLTREFLIAESFALSNPAEINSFSKTDSSVIEINNISDNKILYDITDINDFINSGVFAIDSVNRKTIGFGEIVSTEYSKIVFDTFDHLFHQLEPQYIIFDCKTNDRMKYQKGAFILFYDYVCIKKYIF